MKKAETGTQIPKLMTVEKVALGIAISSALIAVVFGIIAGVKQDATIGLVSGTAGALFGISCEPLWAVWTKRCIAQRKNKTKKKSEITPLYTSEKFAIGVAVASGTFALLFSAWALKGHAALFGAIAVTSGTLFGVSIEPIWKAAKRLEKEQNQLISVN